MRRLGRASAACACAIALASVACNNNDPVYFPGEAPLESGTGMPGPASATLVVPFRPPSEADRQALAEEGQRLMQEVPWLRADQVSLSLLYTITNLGDRPGQARLDIDGASEFVSYDAQALQAAAVAADPRDDAEVLPLIRRTPVILAPGEVYRGTVREDDFHEAALDLDALGRFQAVPASVLINHSSANPIGLEMIPPAARYVRPAIFQVTVRFAASTPMRLEFILRVRDQEDLMARGQEAVFAPEPAGYQPPPAMPPPP